jgi:hypothetical protein
MLTRGATRFSILEADPFVGEPFLNELVEALGKALFLSEDIQLRKAEAESLNWESSWEGDKCCGPTVYKKVARWFNTTNLLW